MPYFNDIDLNDWKNSDIEVDSLWLIDSRDNQGKHDGFYHGNFVPQVARQLIKRYSKRGEIVFDPFIGSGTTLFEAENLGRDLIGIDIQQPMIDYIKEKSPTANVFLGDSCDQKTYLKVKNTLNEMERQCVQLVILHPPYFDIVKFSDNPHDLSNAFSLDDFKTKFKSVLLNSIDILERNRYLAIVIGDKYANGEWIPLGFHLMQEAISCGLRLKSIVVKNMTGNRGKRNKEAIWRYRALSSDYYIFKHEYILLFKNDKKPSARL